MGYQTTPQRAPLSMLSAGNNRVNFFRHAAALCRDDFPTTKKAYNPNAAVGLDSQQILHRPPARADAKTAGSERRIHERRQDMLGACDEGTEKEVREKLSSKETGGDRRTFQH